jgi:hypothetical protein
MPANPQPLRRAFGGHAHHKLDSHLRETLRVPFLRLGEPQIDLPENYALPAFDSRYFDVEEDMLLRFNRYPLKVSGRGAAGLNISRAAAGAPEHSWLRSERVLDFPFDVANRPYLSEANDPLHMAQLARRHNISPFKKNMPSGICRMFHAKLGEAAPSACSPAPLARRSRFLEATLRARPPGSKVLKARNRRSAHVGLPGRLSDLLS